MSVNKGAARRISLLTSSSLIAASLTAASALALAAAPSTAAAQSACTPTPNSGAGTNTVGYTGTQSAGIACTATGLLTINKSGTVTGPTAFTVTSTGGLVLNNTGTIGVSDATNAVGSGGRVDFSGVTGGGVTFNVTGSGRWLASDDSVLSAGADTVTLSGFGVSQMATGASIDFGAGVDTFNLGTAFYLHGVNSLANLETFNNSNVIYFGGFDPGFGTRTTNANPGDVLLAQGAAFTGSGSSRFVLDVSYAAGGQDDCSEGLAADCANFTDGSTSGVTTLTLVNADSSNTGGSASRIVLIDGSDAAEHFVLDPDSVDFVNTDLGPAIQRRLYDFYFRYDADAQQHVLLSAPHVEAFQIASFAAAAQDMWRSTTGTWFDRQADLRATPGGLEPSRGLWVRAGAGVSDRDTAIPLELLGADFGHALSYEQRVAHVSIGADLIGAAGQDKAWVIGVTGGLVRGDTEFDSPATETVFTGVNGGLYASVLMGPLFVDATINASSVGVDSEMASLGFDDNVKLTQTINSVGARLEAGWRVAMNGLFIEPLAGVAYVKSDLDDIVVPGDAGTIGFDEAKSLRAGVGLRGGTDVELMGMNASASLTGRYWEEMEGENGTVLKGNAPLVLVDDFGGSFSELVASLNLFNSDGGVSGFANLGGRFGDDYQSIDGSVGVRLRW